MYYLEITETLLSYIEDPVVFGWVLGSVADEERFETEILTTPLRLSCSFNSIEKMELVSLMVAASMSSTLSSSMFSTLSY